MILAQRWYSPYTNIGWTTLVQYWNDANAPTVINTMLVQCWSNVVLPTAICSQPYNHKPTLGQRKLAIWVNCVHYDSISIQEVEWCKEMYQEADGPLTHHRYGTFQTNCWENAFHLFCGRTWNISLKKCPNIDSIVRSSYVGTRGAGWQLFFTLS